MKKIFIYSIIIAIFILAVYIIKDKYNINLPIKIEKSNSLISKTYNKTIKSDEVNTIWCGNFQLAWNELINYNGDIIKLEKFESEILDDLNEQKFTKEMISTNSYYVKVGNSSIALKDEIENELKDKFNEKKINVFDDTDFNNSNGIFIYSMLKKKFSFLEKFDDLDNILFYENEEKKSEVKMFGINQKSNSKLYNNIEILYWDFENLSKNGFKSNEFAIKLKTQDNEEIILYRTDRKSSFENLYDELQELCKNYQGEKKFKQGDYLAIPNININVNIIYDELCNKPIKGRNGEYISNAIQNITFELNNEGGKLFSESGIFTDEISGGPIDSRHFVFDKSFIIFIKETGKEKPYLAIKVENFEYLEQTY